MPTFVDREVVNIGQDSPVEYKAKDPGYGRMKYFVGFSQNRCHAIDKVFILPAKKNNEGDLVYRYDVNDQHERGSVHSLIVDSWTHKERIEAPEHLRTFYDRENHLILEEWVVPENTDHFIIDEGAGSVSVRFRNNDNW